VFRCIWAFWRWCLSEIYTLRFVSFKWSPAWFTKFYVGTEYFDARTPTLTTLIMNTVVVIQLLLLGWPFLMNASVRCQASPWAIYGVQRNIGTCFSPSTSFSLANYYSTSVQNSFIIRYWRNTSIDATVSCQLNTTWLLTYGIVSIAVFLLTVPMPEMPLPGGNRD